jgi:hypothetical protein
LKVVAAFWEYQIVHFSFGYPERGTPYTTPYLAPIITVWKRHMAKLDSIGLQRLTKAFEKTIHKIPIALNTPIDKQQETIKSYIDNLTKDVSATFDVTNSDFSISSRQKPNAITTEYYIPRHFTQDGKIVDSDIEVKDTTPTGIKELADIELDIKMIITALDVPMHYLPIQVGQRAFVDKTSDKADESFAYRVKNLQLSVIKGLRYLCDLQLLLSGIDPKSVQYELALPVIRPSSTKDSAEIDSIRTNTAKIQLEMNIPKEIVASRVLGLTPEETKLWIENPTPTAPPQETPSKEPPTPNKSSSQT